MKNVVAVVVTYNRVNYLDKVIQSILSQTVVPKKIVIVDNNSSDGTSEFVARNIVEWNCNGEVVIYRNTGENLGGAGGFDFGFNMAKRFDFDYLWLMDDDLLPDPNCLELLLSNDFSGIIQPTRYNLDGGCAELSPVKYDLTNPFLLNPKKKSVKDIKDHCRD